MVSISTSYTLSQFQQQIVVSIVEENYQQVLKICEQWLEADPMTRLPYWYLGLSQLLQGAEAEAQLTWTVALAEVEPEHVEFLTAELIGILDAEANRQATLDETGNSKQLTWLLRQHIREIAPAHVSNLLKILLFSLDQGEFSGNLPKDIGLIDALQTTTPDQIPSQLMLDVVQQSLEQHAEDPRLLDFVAACLAISSDARTIIQQILTAANTLFTVLGRSALAARYGELCLKLDNNNAEALMLLARAYLKDGQYTEGIDMAKRYYAGCQTPLQKAFGNSLVLGGLMKTGAKWSEAALLLEYQTDLLEELLKTYTITSDEMLDAALMCAPLFFYPYFSDSPHQTRLLQNRVSKLVQDSVNNFVLTKVDDYCPYPGTVHVRATERKKIRIAYIAQFMRRHSVGWLSRWVFEHFDPNCFEVYAYFNRHIRIESFTDQWFASKATRACCFNGDALGIAQAIREDEIDILIDLDSLTSDETCNVMAMKAAPIQVSWLGLDASGLPSVDYFIADPYVLPNNAQDYYEEKIWRLPQTYVAVDGFEVGIPTLRRESLGIPEDAVTYLSSQYAYKRNPQTIRLQMQIIRQVPNSFFLIKGAGDQQEIQTLFQQMAESCGVSIERLCFLPQDPNEETHRANLSIADVVLDTYPYNGATTTLETLWMGIPIVTRVGQQFAARNSYTFMMNAGITEGIAWTDDEYVEWGIRLGQDMVLRQQVREKLRQSRHSSPLWNARQFTRELETAYKQMWEIYLQTQV